MTTSKTLLVIDDEKHIRTEIVDYLVRQGFTVTGVEHGAEGLKVLESTEVDLVITDVLMPEKEGIETIIEMRKLRPNLRILAISGGGRMSNFMPLDMARKFGANATLTKPFKLTDLLAPINAVMNEPMDREPV